MSINILAHTKAYAPVFEMWVGEKAKLLGPKPTAEQLASAHGLNCRPGKQALAVAMSLRDKGVTGSQIVLACGAPQLNKMRGLITDSYLKRDAAPMTGEGHTVYKCTVTPKGLTRIKRAVEAAEQLAKAGEAVEATTTRKAARAPGDATATGHKQADKAKAKRAALVKSRKPKVTVATGEPAAPAAVDVTDTPAAVAAEAAVENGANAHGNPTT